MSQGTCQRHFTSISGSLVARFVAASTRAAGFATCAVGWHSTVTRLSDRDVGVGRPPHLAPNKLGLVWRSYDLGHEQPAVLGDCTVREMPQQQQERRSKRPFHSCSRSRCGDPNQLQHKMINEYGLPMGHFTASGQSTENDGQLETLQWSQLHTCQPHNVHAGR